MITLRARAAGFLLLVILTAANALAQSGGGFDLTWNTVDGGGLTFATGGGFTLGTTAGQPDAGLHTGGTFTLNGGFWQAAAIGFTVSKDFSDDSAGTVDVTLVCTSGIVTPATAQASEGAPAQFTVSGYLGAPTCTATESVPAGYTADETNCANVPLTNGTCTISNTLNSASFSVAKDFQDDNPASVTVSLVCTSGLVSPASTSASEGAPAVFTVSGFSGTPTCTATETVPPGYTANEASCANVSLGNGGCTIVNSLNGASFVVSKDFDDDSGAAVNVSVTCTSGLVSPSSAPASEGSPAVFSVTGFSGTPTCTATETVPAGYTANEASCANVSLGSGGCTITNTLNIASFSVAKDFSDDSAATVTMSLACTSGFVSPASASASEGSPAVFTVTGFSGTPNCTATETVPAGYTADESACANVGLAVGSCTIVNTLNTTRITIVQTTNPSPDPSNTEFTYNADGGLVPTTFTLRDGESQDFDVSPGSGYSIAQVPPAGWTVTSATCSNGSSPDNISVAPGEMVTCTFVTSQAAAAPANIPALDGLSLLVLLMSLAGVALFAMSRRLG